MKQSNRIHAFDCDGTTVSFEIEMLGDKPSVVIEGNPTVGGRGWYLRLDAEGIGNMCSLMETARDDAMKALLNGQARRP